MIKAVFFDIDGTLLDHSAHAVPESTIRAVEALREKGILTFTATGRHVTQMDTLPLGGMTFDGAVALNGQYCTNTEGVIYRCPIPRQDIAALLDYLKQDPHPCILIEEDGMFINFHNAYVERVQAAIRSPMPPLGDMERGYTEPVYQALLYISDEDKARLPPLPGIRFSSWRLGGPELSGAELYPVSGGKAVGIEKVLAHYGIDRSETMAFGDGENDVDMFGVVGTAVCMGNGCQEAKDAADYVTDDIDNDGIWKALVHFGVL